MTDEPAHGILFLAANPACTAQLALDQECRAIETELRLTSTRDSFVFQSKWAVDVHEMMRHLNALQPTIVHFSGHGGAGADSHVGPANGSAAHRDVGNAGPRDPAGIHLHGEAGHSQPVGPDALAQMIRSAAPSARIVVLNSCFSDAVADAFADTVDCVVGMHGSIGDEAARAFSVGFYRALGYGRSVGNAVAQANAGLAALQLPGNALPTVRTRSGVDADELYVARAAPPATGHVEDNRSASAAHKLLNVIERRSAVLLDDELFAAGVRHYASVVRATHELKAIFQERLIQCIDKHAFHTFVVDDDWQLRLGRYASDSDVYVAITVRGRIEQERCVIDVGLWWPRAPDPALTIYAGFHGVPWSQKIRPRKPETQRDVTRALTYLRRDATRTLDFDDLLDELEAAARIARAS